jgi:hypothetical protein
MFLKSHKDIECDLIVDTVKADSKNVRSYLKSIGWKGPVRDYVDVKFLSQQESIAGHFLFWGLIFFVLIGLIVFGVNITGNAVEGSYGSYVGNSFGGLFIFLIGLIGLIIKLKK